MAVSVTNIICAVLLATGSVTAVQKLVPRVIGGQPVFNRCSEPFSWTVALRLPTSQGPVTYCSGVLLSDRLVLTAARCLYLYLSQGSASGHVVVGERDLDMTDFGERAIDIESFKIHPGYNDTTLDDNIALLRLASPVTSTPCMTPARQFQDDPQACDDVDTSCTIVGWGPYAENSQVTNSRVPRYASVQVYDEPISRVLSVQDKGVEPARGSRLAEARVTGVKSCLFDWGGVVSCQRNKKQVLRGIVGDHNCYATPTPPMAVTDVPTYSGWINACYINWGLCQSL